MARIILCSCLLLQACASHSVRCDARLQAINATEQPTAAVANVSLAGHAKPAGTSP
jgi:hypothetical protein